MWDEPSWVLSKRNKVKFVSDWTECSNKCIKKNNDPVSAVKNGKMFHHNDIEFKDWLPELYRIMKDGTHTYIMINGRNLKDIWVEAEIAGNTEQEKEKIRSWWRQKKKWFVFQNILVWNKWNVTPNKFYMQGVEFILMFRKWKARNINNLWSKNIIDIPNIIWNKQHPTEKPVELYSFLMGNSVNKWDTVIDPFAGSWPITHAAKIHNVNCMAIEIDEEYFNIFNDYI